MIASQDIPSLHMSTSVFKCHTLALNASWHIFVWTLSMLNMADCVAKNYWMNEGFWFLKLVIKDTSASALLLLGQWLCQEPTAMSWCHDDIQKALGVVYVVKNWSFLPSTSSNLPDMWVSLEMDSLPQRSLTIALADILTAHSWEYETWARSTQISHSQMSGTQTVN
jgi:hypothetical protein